MRDVNVLVLILAICQLLSAVVSSETIKFGLPPKPPAASGEEDFKYLWLSSDGVVHNESAPGRLEIAATPAITEKEHQTGAFIVKMMTRFMPPEVFANLAMNASVGLFTKKDKTTVFPEYADLKDRPECKGTCEDECEDTCTIDGRKYDALEGLGGIRATCVNDNFMCTGADPYKGQFSVLVHEFGHTVHLYGLPETPYHLDRIRRMYKNARSKEIWDLDSYAMSNEREYFAVATAVFFNVDNHRVSKSATEMNSCGHTDKTCGHENEAKRWLAENDPTLFAALSYAYTHTRPTFSGGLVVCVSPP